MAKIRLVIKRKPASPPSLDPFECLVCHEMIERDAYNPNFQQPPLCFQCSYSALPRIPLAGAPFDTWADFRRGYAMVAVLEKEISDVRNR